MTVAPGRFTADIEGDFVVFLIGMRINKPWLPHRWLPVFFAMPAMLRELDKQPQLGLLHWRLAFEAGGPTVIQFWRSFEQLEAYARNPDAVHLPAWKRFNQRVRASGDVGIWHETYRVAAGQYEAMYGNMPRFGLARAGDHVTAGSTSTAARRLGERDDDVAPVEGY